jgi:hypothetical protein
MEVIDLNINDLEPMSISVEKPSVNFGTGIELLMNDKKRSSNNNVKLDLSDLDNLENELNELSGNKSSSNSSGDTKKVNGFSNFFNNFGMSSTTTPINEKSAAPDLGQAAKETMSNNTKTWDGFTKVNDLPQSSKPMMNDKEKRRKKRMMIKKLEEWYEKGLVKNISHFNVDSDYDEIEDEYETALEDKRKKDGVKLQKWWFITFVNSLEYANSAFNPFDINLDGWGEQVSEDIESYEEIFGELHDKYKGGKLAPELSLLLRLGFSAAVLNFTNKALSSATPGFNDVIKQSPDLMRMFTNATVESMTQNSPGFAFANNLVNNPDSINTSFGPPHPRPGMQFTPAVSNRPDLNISRGGSNGQPMFREGGVDVNSSYGDINERQPIQRQPIQRQEMQPIQRQEMQPIQRQEMRGPSDINHIISNISNLKPPIIQEDDSMISISSLKDLQNTNLPKTTKRKQRSDKNTISLDI